MSGLGMEYVVLGHTYLQTVQFIIYLSRIWMPNYVPRNIDGEAKIKIKSMS